MAKGAEKLGEALKRFAMGFRLTFRRHTTLSITLHLTHTKQNSKTQNSGLQPQVFNPISNYRPIVPSKERGSTVCCRLFGVDVRGESGMPTSTIKLQETTLEPRRKVKSSRAGRLLFVLPTNGFDQVVIHRRIGLSP